VLALWHWRGANVLALWQQQSVKGTCTAAATIVHTLCWQHHKIMWFSFKRT
jgi:hypothetical protein